MKLQTGHKLFIACDLAKGKLFEVAHVAKSVEEANQFMSEHPETGLMDEVDGLCYITNLQPSDPQNA